MASRPNSLRSLAPILVCFFLSGAAGLIYQVAWGKALGLIFGHTVYAIATVLAVFMGGLALGSAWLGRWSERRAQQVALYGWIELGVAASGALSLAGLAAVRGLYFAAYPALGGSAATLLVLRFLGAAIVLLLPTFLMGGTLPILVRGLTHSSAELGARVSRLYWVNTAGAVVGTLAAGFVLLPALGLRLTVAVAVALNVLAGGVALGLARSYAAAAAPEGVGAAPETKVETRAEGPAETSQPATGLLLACFSAVGATAIADEIGWTRLLATTLGSSTYAFTLMLGTFLAGIVLGSMLFEKWSARGGQVRMSTFAVTQTLTAVAALLFLIFFQQLPRVVPPILRATHETFGGLILAQFVTSALVMLPVALVFGFNFPAVTVLVASRSSARGGYGAAVGRAYAANTFGAIAGATLTGFWLVPRLGAFRVLAIAAAVNLLLAIVLELRSAPRRMLALASNLALAAVLAAVMLSGAFYNRAQANFGTVLYWNLYRGRLTLPETVAVADILFAADGLNASISVARSEDYYALRSNGKVDASTGDAKTQLVVGHLGPIFHPAPRRVLVIGFGSGMTVSALARYPEVERIDCVEIEPAVLRAAPYLPTLNRGVLSDRRVRVIFDDARNFLLTTRDKYDLIISEPSNPWIAGVATLFTEEYYQAARDRLAPGGVFVQWIQAYSLYPEDLRMVLGTFVPHFSKVTLWHGNYPDLVLMARTESAPVELERLRRLWSNPELHVDYRELGLRQPEGLLGYFLLDDADLRRAAAGAARNTDDRTSLEYRAPRALLAKRLEDENRQMLMRYRSALLPQDVRVEDPSLALWAMADTLMSIEEEAEAGRVVAALAKVPPTAASETVRGRWELERGRSATAKAAYEAALRLDRTSLEAALGLAEIARRNGDFAAAEVLYGQMLARNPNFVSALSGMMSAKRGEGAFREAVDWQAKRIAADPSASHVEYARLGELLIRAGDLQNGERYLLEALHREPYSYAAHRNLGGLYRSLKLWPQARAHLEFVARYFPDQDATTYTALAEVYRASGEVELVTKILRKGHRLFPDDPELARLALVQ